MPNQVQACIAIISIATLLAALPSWRHAQALHLGLLCRPAPQVPLSFPQCAPHASC